jgi:hypothetical protein
VLKTLSEHTEGEDLSLSLGFLGGIAVRHNTRKLGNFSQPAPVLFTLTLDAVLHEAS